MDKLKKVRQKLKEKELDAILITNPFNRRYITGFTGTAGAVLISKKKSYLITDFRYTEQASKEATVFDIIEHKGNIELDINRLLKENSVNRLAFENDVTYAKYEQFQKTFTDLTLIPEGNIIEEIRLIKSEDELKIMKEAAEIADAAYEHIQTVIKPGIREIDVANELEFYMRKKGATSSSFDTIVASGYRSALPHGVASDKKIENGELVTLDYGALYKGYCSDITRTLAVGEVSETLRNIYDTVLEAQKQGVAQIKAGMTGREADALTRKYIDDKGYGEYFGHSTGHGLGLEVHEGPRVSPKSDEVLLPGMVVTVEPGIYIPQVGGCRIEDDIVITDTGNVRLTTSRKEFVQL